MPGNLILIIDDDQTQHLILGNYLEKAGYKVIHAENGVQGLKTMEEQKPELILLDIQMPVMDGFKTLEAIRKKSGFKDIPVLLLTSLDRDYLKIKGLELGADDYVTKPFNEAELMARVKAALRRAERNRPSEGGMEGNLSDIGLTDILQSLQLGSKTASIFLPGMDAEIFIQNGSVSGVRQGNFKGYQALARIFLLEKGPFSVRFNEIPKDLSEDSRPLMSVLMSVLADVDEIKDIINRIRAEERLIKVDDDIAEFPVLEKFRTYPPLSFIDMIVSMDGELKENLKTLVAASKKGKLKVVKL